MNDKLRGRPATESVPFYHAVSRALPGGFVMLSDQRFCFTVRKIPVSFIQKRLLPDGGSGFFQKAIKNANGLNKN